MSIPIFQESAAPGRCAPGATARPLYHPNIPGRRPSQDELLPGSQCEESVHRRYQRSRRSLCPGLVCWTDCKYLLCYCYCGYSSINICWIIHLFFGCLLIFEKTSKNLRKGRSRTSWTASVCTLFACHDGVSYVHYFVSRVRPV